MLDLDAEKHRVVLSHRNFPFPFFSLSYGTHTRTHRPRLLLAPQRIPGVDGAPAGKKSKARNFRRISFGG